MVSITLHNDSAILFTVIGRREHSITVTADGNTGQEREINLLLAALKRFKRPCEMIIYCGPYVYGILNNRWLDRWAQSGWVNAKGKPVRYKEKWQQVYDLIREHTYAAERRET